MLNNWSIFMQSYLKSVNYQNFYKNIIKIFNNENIPCIFDNTNIINQNQHPQVKYGQKLISKIENSSYLHIIKFNDLIQYIPKNWKYYNNLLNTINKKDIIIFKTNFAQPTFLFHLFEKIGLVSYPFNNKDEIILKNDFIKNVGICDGACVFLNNVNILFLNTQSYNKITISHEITHYFQNILNIHLLNDIIKYDKKLNILSLDENYFKYIFSQKEFFVHIYVNLYQDLKKIFSLEYLNDKKYFNKEFNKFIDYINKLIQDNQLHILDTEFGQYYIKHTKNISPICILSACYFLNKTNLYQKIINKLKENL